MADEPKLVTALEVRLNAFEKQLKDAGLIAEREVKHIEDTFAKANPQFSGTFLGSFLGTAAAQGAKELIGFVSDLVDRFKQLERIAKLANIAMNDLFGLQEAAHKLGAPITEVTTSVRNLATLLDEMKRGESNSLSKLLDANPQALKGMNREALTFEQTLGIVADLVRNARTEIEKIDIAKAGGQAESMVKSLELGSVALLKLRDDAAKAAPDLQRLANLAAEFDKAWDTAVKNVKAYLLQDGLSAVKDFIETITGWMVTFGEALQKVTFGPMLGPIQRATDAWRTLNEQIQYARLADAFGPAADHVLDNRRSGDVAGGGTTTRDPNAPLSNVPAKSKGAAAADPVEAAIGRIVKRTAATEAETSAINKGTEAREAAKIEAELLAVAEQKNGKVTEEQRERIEAVAAAYGHAAAQIEQSRAPLETFARESANLGKLMNDFAATSLNNVTNELANIVTGSKSAAEAFSALAKSIANDLAKMAIRTLITGPIAESFKGLFPVGGASSPLFAAAGGGTFGAGRWGVVGEQGPELIQTHAGGGVSVYPKMPGFANGGYLPAPSQGGAAAQGAQITINAPGADAAGLARVEMAVLKLNRSLETRAVRAVTDASSRGHTIIKR